MKPYSYINNSLKSVLHPNEDVVLEEFYEQRKKRSTNSTKRHSLLQKNASYFSNSNYLNQSVGLCKTPQHSQKNVLFTSNKSNCQQLGAVFQNQKKANKDIFTSVKDQIKDRNRSATQLQIMNKYRNIDKENAIPTCRFGFEDINPIKTKDQFASTSKYCDRKVSLVQLENSFKTLTGSQLAHSKNQQFQKKEADIQKIDDCLNFRQKFKRYMPSGKFIEEEQEKKLQASRQVDFFNVNENIKIVNKVKNSSSKEKPKQEFIKIKQIVGQNIQDEQPLLVMAQHREIKSQSSSVNQCLQDEDEISEATEQRHHFLNSPAEVIQNLKSSSYCAESPNFKFAQSNFPEEEKSQMQKSRNQKQPSKQKNKLSKVGQLQHSRQIKDTTLKRQYNTYLIEDKDPLEKPQKLLKKEQVSQLRQKQLQAQVNELKKKVDQLQKINKKQSKFIESVQTMRKVIDKTETPCNLKQLWRWLKGLPNRI